jgi:hypothetical protein
LPFVDRFADTTAVVPLGLSIGLAGTPVILLERSEEMPHPAVHFITGCTWRPLADIAAHLAIRVSWSSPFGFCIPIA